MRHSSPTPERVTHSHSATSQPPEPAGPEGSEGSPRLVDGLCDFTDVETIYHRHYRTLHISTATFKRNHDLLDSTNPVPLADIVAVADAIYAELDDDREHFTILTCRAQPELEIYGFKVIASGSVCHVDVPYDAVIRSALLLGARAIILLHNHPSGHLRPSSRDVILTNRLHFLADMVGVEVIDHFTYHPTVGALSTAPQKYLTRRRRSSAPRARREEGAGRAPVTDEQRSHRRAGRRKMGRYFWGAVLSMRPFFPAIWAPSSEPDAAQPDAAR